MEFQRFRKIPLPPLCERGEIFGVFVQALLTTYISLKLGCQMLVTVFEPRMTILDRVLFNIYYP